MVRTTRNKSTRAGLTISASRQSRMLKQVCNQKRRGKAVDVYLAGVLEYVAGEILDEACKIARESKTNTKTVTPRHILHAIGGDAELTKILHVGSRNGIVNKSGVIPDINSFIMQRYALRHPKKNTKDASESAPAPKK